MPPQKPGKSSKPSREQTPMTVSITVLGGGNMAEALIGGAKQAEPGRYSLSVVEVNRERRDWLSQRFADVSVTPTISPEQLAGAELCVLAVKPQQAEALLSSLPPPNPGHEPVFVSIAAGLRLEQLQHWSHRRGWVRAMPNTPAMIQQGMTGLIAAAEVAASARQAVTNLFSQIGEVVWLADENEMDALTAISGSGPAYFFYWMQALFESARALGFTEATATQLVKATALGATSLAANSPKNFAELQQQVTSKGGTTEAAINVLIANRADELLKLATEAACQKSRDMSAR